MKIEKLKEELKKSIDTLPGANVYYRDSWGCEYFNIDGKSFGMLGTNSEDKPILTIKGEPSKNLELREIYPFIVPGYYSNKEHWNSILLEESNLTTKELEKLLKESYKLVFNKLTKKRQQELQK